MDMTAKYHADGEAGNYSQLISDRLEYGEILSDRDSSPNKYVDYNYAFCQQAENCLNAGRPGSSGNVARNINSGKRCQTWDDTLAITGSGKVCNPSAVNSFQSAISLFPSGLFSGSRIFISFRHLII